MSDLKVLVFAQKKGTALSGTALELLNIGRQLADKLSGKLGALVIGNGTDACAKAALAAGADVCYTVENGALDKFADDAYAKVLAELVASKSPQIVLGPANFYGKAYSADLRRNWESVLPPTVPSWISAVKARWRR